MAGNRQIFEQAMRQGINYAWDRQWKKAVAEYERAIAELPDEAPAYTALGQALVNVGRHSEALGIYQRAARLTPNDPMALTRVAELQEQTGDQSGATQTWLLSADMHLRGRDIDAAVEIWQHIVQVSPGVAAAHERLAKFYAGIDQTGKAIQEYLILAAIYQQQGFDEQATAVCRNALELDPRNPDVLTAVEALRQGRSLSQLIQDKPTSAPYAGLRKETDRGNGAASPVETARQKALTELAGALLEDSTFEETALATALLQGIDMQTRGETEAAIEYYQRAVGAGIQHPAALFNLGLLYQETLHFEQALALFQRVLDDPDYSLGAHFASGECLRALGRLGEAIVHFVNVLQQIDLSTVEPDHTEELRRTYDGLSRRYSKTARRSSVVTFVNSLVEFLGSEHWEEKVLETRQQLDRVGGGRVISLAEILALPDSERILASMVQSQDFVENGMLHSAAEECLWAIEHSPDYLPLHLHLAQLFMKSNQMARAVSKYLYVADTFAVRDEMDKAKDLYEQVLSVAPMDLNVRQKLIGLLLEHRMVGQALEHQMALADAHYELAQIEAARDEYNEALRLASLSAESDEWTARVLHRLGDIDLQRLDWRAAIEVYLRLKESVPGDIKARQRLVQLNFNLERRREALAELDELISMYRQQDNLVAALGVIDELLATRPEELELHKRAAQISVQTRNKEGAISHLDAMGELQLQTGRVQEAEATIRAIIALRPENVEAYRQLLEQIV